MSDWKRVYQLCRDFDIEIVNKGYDLIFVSNFKISEDLKKILKRMLNR